MKKKHSYRFLSGLLALALFLANAPLASAETQDAKFENINVVLNKEQTLLKEGIRSEMEREAVTDEQKAWVKREIQNSIVFRIDQIAFTGNRAISTKDLQKFVKPYLGREYNLEGVQDVISEVKKYYQKKRRLATSVSAPPQDVKTGKLTLKIHEGKRGAVFVTAQPELDPIALSL